ncbi:MAG: hypothetical protein ING00_13430 [Roseomonas sp.]|nr:hypothetical protein [Roseomonas sp.]
MAEPVRLLNEDGTRLFREYVDRARKGSSEALPLHLLTDHATSLQPDFAATIVNQQFASRAEFGRYLVGAFKDVGRRRISREAGVWNWLALRYFDQLCPPSDSGARKVLATGHYVLEGRFAHNRYYRHLVRAAWYATELHGDDATILLTSAGKPSPGIGQWGEISEQLAGYQDILGSRTAILVAARLFLDHTGATKRGAASPDGGGSVRRLSTVLRQLAMTHDLRTAELGEVVAMLPNEFEAFRGGPNPGKKRSLLRRFIGGAEASG